MKIWRTSTLIRMGYDDAEYRRPELLWSQKKFRPHADDGGGPVFL